MTNAWESIVYFYQQKLDNTLQDQSSSILDDFHFYIIFKNGKEDDKYLDQWSSLLKQQLYLLMDLFS